MRPKNNPFRCSRTDALEYLPLNTSWEEILARLERINRRGTVMGPKGTGKTTFLHSLARILEDQGYQVAVLSAGKQNTGEVIRAAGSRGSDSALLVDSAERLSLAAWLVLRVRARGLGVFVVSTHKRFRMPLLLKTGTSPELLYDLARKLTREISPIRREESNAIHKQFNGNLRNAFRYLYDRYGEGFVGRP